MLTRHSLGSLMVALNRAPLFTCEAEFRCCPQENTGSTYSFHSAAYSAAGLLRTISVRTGLALVSDHQTSSPATASYASNPWRMFTASLLPLAPDQPC
nr:hypothetical protein CFP56_04237 [Quercus suber]